MASMSDLGVCRVICGLLWWTAGGTHVHEGDVRQAISGVYVPMTNL